MITLPRDVVDFDEPASEGEIKAAKKLIALAKPLVGQDHYRKVFISELARVAKAPSPRTFAVLLIRLNRLGLIQLSRADMPFAYDMEKVGRSEIVHSGAAFHFVDVG